MVFSVKSLKYFVAYTASEESKFLINSANLFLIIRYFCKLYFCLVVACLLLSRNDLYPDASISALSISTNFPISYESVFENLFGVLVQTFD